uniref:Uncharacterized protein n=1 Tax=Myoviridae sp. ct5Xl4 TaxID=2826613 RepID=A0A8S5M263_9CAUD|nr:MAG TPA: hypothetical protein [Myoviridae sp. ct5Xl4]
MTKTRSFLAGLTILKSLANYDYEKNTFWLAFRSSW